MGSSESKGSATWVMMILAFLLYCGAGGMGFELALWQPFAPLIWPPAGLAAAILILSGRKFLPVIFLGALVIGILENHSFSIALGLAIAYSAGGGIFLLLRRIDFNPNLEKISHVAAFVGIAVFLSPLVSSLLAAGILHHNYPQTTGNFWQFWPIRWLSDALGVLSIAPFLIVWKAQTRVNWRNSQTVEVLLWLATIIFFGAMVFRHWAPTDTLRYPLELCIFPLMAWAAFRFGPRGVVTGILIVSLMAVWELRDVLGPNPSHFITQPPSFIWVFVGILSITSLFLAAIISELSLKEENSREDSERLRAIVNAAPDLMLLVDNEGIILESLSHQFEGPNQVFQDKVGRGFQEALPPATAQKIMAKIQEVYRDGLICTYRYSLEQQGVEYHYEGRFAPVAGTGIHDRKILWIAYDITAAQLAHKALRRRDQLFKTLTEVESILLKESEKDIGLHEALKALFKGLEMSWAGIYRLKNEQWSDPVLVAASKNLDEDPLKERWHYLISGESVMQSIKNKGWCRVSKADETHSVWLFWQIEVFGSKQFVLALNFDDSGQLEDSFIPSFGLLASSFGSYVEGRKVEEQLKISQENAILANRAKSEFLAMMSHEIRTPLNAILGFADLIQKASTKDQLEEYLEIISRSSRELLELMNNILDFSKFESEQLTLEKTVFRLETIAMEALELFSLRVKEKGLKLNYAIKDPTAGYYLGDPFRLKQILTNLLSNAVKFTREGEIELNLDVTEEENFASRWVITVRDTGIGIASEKLAEIFDPFVQADSSTTREFGGTGLGLAITKRLVERMNGKIRVESALGAGSIFIIELPMPCAQTTADAK